MIQVSNLQQRTCPFEEYLQMPGFSHSGIRNEGRSFKPPTAKMQLGTLVHNYLLTPREYEFEQHEIVKPLAEAVKAKLGSLLKYLQPEVAVTADFIHNGFNLPYKGRIDLVIPGKIVVDLKVSETPTYLGVKMFGYDNAISGYCLAAACRVGLIVSINPKTKQIFVHNIPIETAWWEYQIKQKGTVI